MALQAAMLIASLAAGMCPPFPGESDFDQLGRVVEVLGSISLQDWPEAEHMPDFHKVPPGAMTSSQHSSNASRSC